MLHLDQRQQFPPAAVALLFACALIPGCGGDSGSSPEANAAPTARIAPVEPTQVGVVLLDGTGSTDPDGDPVFHFWTLVSRPPGSSSTIQPWAVDKLAFGADVPGTYVVSLVVTDGSLSSAPATASFAVTPYYGTLTAQVRGTSGVITVDVTARSVVGIASVAAQLNGLAIGTLTAPNYCEGGLGCSHGGVNNLYRFLIDGAAIGVGIHPLVITATDPDGRQQQTTVQISVTG